MISAKLLIVYGTKDFYFNLKQLVSQALSWTGSKIIFLTGNNALSSPVRRQTGTLSKQVYHKDLF